MDPFPRGAHNVYESVKYRAKYEKTTTREVEITRERGHLSGVVLREILFEPGAEG